ncbi:MAG: pantetheine-phosphate adenylyltransferase [Candidatus Electryonea clarkiae]|nr:pantetheine-phosphate adenylyltransferase [Candidatus Electryonea clarkiae]MDP8289055.1 pantetheine-phosphate adenylyltransferase [Candidatus Electryonea clarkiae]
MPDERVAIYPGTFDPITNGHVDIIQRAVDLFDRVVVALALNPGKEPLFSIEEREEMVREAMNGWERVEVAILDGLAVEGAAKHNAIALIRGLRAVSDFEYEFQMALMNMHLAPNLHTVYLMPNEKYTYLNSTIIKGVALHGGNISRFVPSNVEKKLFQKYNDK